MQHSVVSWAVNPKWPPWLVGLLITATDVSDIFPSGDETTNNKVVSTLFCQVQRCMSFTEKIVVGQISGKVMHSGKVMYMSFTENSFKAMQEIPCPVKASK